MLNIKKKSIIIYYFLVYTLVLSLIIFINNLHPLIHPEKVSNLVYLWDANINNFLKPFNSCRLDACIGRFRPLDYVFELIDALFIKYQIILTKKVNWVPLSTYVCIFFSPIIFAFINKRNKILSLIFIFLFFSSFQFLSDFYNYFRPGKHLAFLFFIATSYAAVFKYEELASSLRKEYLLIFLIPALFDEQIIMFIFFYSAVLFVKKRNVNTFNISLVIIFLLYLVFTLAEHMTALTTLKYLKNDSYRSKEFIMQRIDLFISNSLTLNFETLRFVFLNNKLITLIIFFTSLFTISSLFLRKFKFIQILAGNRKFIKPLLADKKQGILLYLLSGIFIYLASAFLHPGIFFGKTQGLSYYFLIPGFIYFYTIFITFENLNIKYSFIFKCIAVILLPFIVMRNLSAMNNNLVWHSNVWNEVNTRVESNIFHGGWYLHTWQSGAHLTSLVNKGCKWEIINMESIGEIEKIVYKKYICESFLKIN